MASNSDSKVPTQQSVKAYVDANAGGGGSGSATPPSYFTAPQGHDIATFGTEWLGSTIEWETGVPKLESNTTGSRASIVYNAHLRERTWMYPNPAGEAFLVISGLSGGCDIFFKFISRNISASNQTNDQIGIDLTKTSGTINPQSLTADGTTSEYHSISGDLHSFSGRGYKYSFSYDGETVDFYVDGVLKNSHSSNVPRMTGDVAEFHKMPTWINPTSDDLIRLYINNFSLSWDQI